jgi:superoxide dismutase, Cu-Zn family
MKAICVLHQNKYKGYILFTELKNYTKIEVKLSGLPPGKRGFHIHEKGNLMDGCKTLCAHYNPFNTNHGGLNKKDSHVGDLGNLEVDTNGNVDCILKAKKVRLSGEHSVIGRSIVIHDKEDDLGKGGNEESLKTGNAGSRIACGIIGYF